MNNSDCELQIQELKEQRRKAREAFDNTLVEKNHLLADYLFKKHRTGSDIPFELLSEMEEGVPLPLPVVYGGAIMTTKQKLNNDNVVKYKTNWTSGSTLTWHYHSNCEETIEILEGRAKVYVEGQVFILGEGDALVVSAGSGHQVTALKASTIDVTFTRVANAQLKMRFDG